MNLDQTWKECLKMWKWIAEVYDGNSETVCILKATYIKENHLSQIIANCFFCQFNDEAQDEGDDGCINCPGKLVDSRFHCHDDSYNYNYKTMPKEFYQELLRLNAIRLERIK